MEGCAKLTEEYILPYIIARKTKSIYMGIF